VEKINATVSGEEFIEGEEFARTPPLSSGMAPEALREFLVRHSGPGILATFAFPSLWNDLRASASQAKPFYYPQVKRKTSPLIFTNSH